MVSGEWGSLGGGGVGVWELGVVSGEDLGSWELGV